MFDVASRALLVDFRHCTRKRRNSASSAPPTGRPETGLSCRPEAATDLSTGSPAHTVIVGFFVGIAQAVIDLARPWCHAAWRRVWRRTV
jgi:hypothetical protein